MENFVIVPLESMEPFHFVAHAGKPDYAEYKNPAEFYNSQVELPSVRSLDEVIQLWIL